MTAVDEVVLEITQRHALPSGPLVPLRGLGSVNHVFILGSGSERYVVRIPIDRLRQDEFPVEYWCLEQAAKQGIPSPEVIGRGVVSGSPYIVLRFVEGSAVRESGTGVWETLGRYGRAAHAMEWGCGPDQLFTRFGRDPDDAWRRHLQYNIDSLTGSDPLIGLGVYRSAEQPRIRALVGELLDGGLGHGLRHGDLAPRNLIAPPHGPPVLLDWGQASVGPIPHGDLLAAFRSHLLDGHPTERELGVFSLALGAPLSSIRDELERLLVLESLDRVRWALDQRPDRAGDLVKDARHTLRALSGI